MNHSHRGRNLPVSFLLFLSLFSGGVEIKRLEYLVQKKLFPFRRSLYSFDRWLADLAGNFVVQGRVNLAVRKWTGRDTEGYRCGQAAVGRDLSVDDRRICKLA